MRQLTEAWFEFGGIRCDDKKVRIMAMPERPIPAHQGEKIRIDGRSGYLWRSSRGARKDIVINVECSTEDGYSPDELAAWLQGEGLLRFSDEPDRAYRARVTDEFARSNMFLRFDKQVFTVPFSCQPYRYIYPAAEPETLTDSKTIYNPGSARSLPRITVEGDGDMVVYIGDAMISAAGAGFIVDSEAMDCYELDGITLANSRVSMDEYPEIEPGYSTVALAGGVTRVTIDGRWRSA